MTSPLEGRFQQPAGWQWQEKFETRAGQYIRYGWVVPSRPKALVVILPGLSEYCEKYFEVAHDLLARNMAVVVLDWRGHGLSWRHLPDRTKRHHDDFANDVADAHAMMNVIGKLPALARLPKILLGHSMGGHLALRCLHDYPDLFACAALSAPMQGINLPFDGQGLIRSTIQFLNSIGWSEHYVPGGMAWSDKFFSMNMMQLTSDKPRGDMQYYWMTTKPDLQPGGLTYGWLNAALQSMRLTSAPEYLQAIHTPCLISIAGRDKIVSNHAIEATADFMPNAEILRVPGSLHEVLMEVDTLRNTFWHAFDAFIAKHLSSE